MKHVSYSLMMFLLLFTVASAQTTAESFEKLLPDMGADDMSVREKSQEAWQKICMEAGAPGKKELLDEVNRLMAAQLDKDVPLETKYWLLQQLQWTGDASVIPAIAKLLENKDLRIRDRAARALALNPAKEAEAALRTALESADGVRGKTIADALASRTPNLEVGTEKEMPAYFSEKDFDAAMKDFNGKSLEGKVRALTAVKTRKASKYLPDVLEAAKSDNQDLRYAALFALEKVGTAKELPLLLDMLFSFDRDKTEWVMTGIAAPGFDEALLQALGAEKDNGRFETLANLLSKRATREAKGPILNRAAADGVNNRVQLLAAAERIASKASPRLLKSPS